MKRVSTVLFVLLALAVLLNACASAPVTEDVSNSVRAQDATDVSERTAAPDEAYVPTDTDSSGPVSRGDVTRSADAKPAGEGASAAAETPSAGDPASSSTSAASGSDGSTGVGITAAQPAQTTKPSGTQSVSGTTEPAGTTKPAGGSASGNPSAESATSAAPTVRGDGLSGKMTYLKEAAVTYVSALNAEDLERFGINGKDQQNEILKNKNGWAAYTIQIDFVNNEAVPVTIYYLDVPDNGQGDVYVNGDTAGELGLGPGAKITERFYVLAKKSDSDGSVLRKLHNMTMLAQYAATPEDDNVTPPFVSARIG